MTPEITVMTDADQLLEELDRILQAEVEAYEQLLQLQQAETRLAVAHALEPFLANLNAKMRQASTITVLEQRRDTVLARLASRFQIAAGSLSLKQLSQCVGAPHAEKFLAHRASLKTLLTDLQRVNRENQILLRDSLAFIEEALTFLAQLMPEHLTYQSSGGFARSSQGRIISGRV